MTLRRFPHAGVGVLAATICVAVSGCAGAGAEPGAAAFVHDHAASVALAAAAVRGADARLERLQAPASAAQLAALERAAAGARRDVVGVSEWDVGEKGEEEDLEQAQREVTEGATRLVSAMSALQAYAGAPRAAALARYRSERARGREQWNQGVGQLWYLAHRSQPPTV